MAIEVLFIRFIAVLLYAAALVFTPWPWKLLVFGHFVGGLAAYLITRLLPPETPDWRAVEAERAWCRAIMKAAHPSFEPPTCDKLVA